MSRLDPLGSREPQKVCEQRSTMRKGAVRKAVPQRPKCPPFTHSNLSTPGIPGDRLALSLWEELGPLAPRSCARGPLGGRKQCIVMLASRISCSSPGAGRGFVEMLPGEPRAARPGSGSGPAGSRRGGVAQSKGDLGERAYAGSGCSLLIGPRDLQGPAHRPPGSGWGPPPSILCRGCRGSDGGRLS